MSINTWHGAANNGLAEVVVNASKQKVVKREGKAVLKATMIRLLSVAPEHPTT